MPVNSENQDVVLEARTIVKTFPGVRALDCVDFQLQPQEIHALVGENGAGKSTLIHILAGVYQADSGSIILKGRPVSFPDTHTAARHGISVVFQELSLAGNLSVAENIFANRQPIKRLNLIDWSRLYAQTREILRLFELNIDPRTPLERLSMAQQQVVEILKAVSQDPKVLILDEPTSALTNVETVALFSLIKKLKSQGIAVIYISHHLHEIFDLADRVTVLRDGKNVDTCLVKDVTEEDLVRKMVGRELVNMYGACTGPIGAEIFRVEAVGRADDFHNISFSVKKGEILGLAGLAGAGRTELARAIFGVEPLDRGSIFLDQQPVQIRSPHQAIEHRIAYLTEDRKEQGLFLRMAMRDNTIAPSLARFTTHLGLMDEKGITKFAETSRKDFNVVTPSIHQEVTNLSGGNQQKVLLSMWMGIQPLLLMVDEPTRGVDVGARSEIYHLLRHLAAQGVGIIMISSDLLEILGLSSRILVMRNGLLAGEFTRDQATEENIIACASGVSLSN